MPRPLAWPLMRFLEALEAVDAFQPLRLLLLFLGLALGWWIYVPIHEMLHVAGCLVSGGEVHQLHLQSIYGAEVLSRLFPFVTSGGEMAGRLSGFDTHGSDICYALTVLMPFLPGLLGFSCLALAAKWRRTVLFAMSLPWAAAPLLTLTGDMYELGSLGLYQLWPLDRGLIGDDLPLLLSERFQLAFDAPSLFIAVAALLGLALALALLHLSARLSLRLVPVMQTPRRPFV